MNSKLKRKLYITITVLLVCIGGGLLYGLYWVRDFSEICTEEEMRYNAENLNNTEALPANFYRVYDSLYPNTRSVSMSQQVWSRLGSEMGVTDSLKNCRCDEIGYISWNNQHFTWKYNRQKLLETPAAYTKFGFGLEKYASPEKCFDYWIQHGMYYRSEQRYFTSLHEFANILYQKNMDALSDKEMVVLISYRLFGAYPVNLIK